MTLSLILPPELEKRLEAQAERQGLSADAYALRILDQHIPQNEKRDAAIEMLQSWNDEPDEPDAADYDFFQALDDARPSYRKLYPPELKGKSW